MKVRTRVGPVAVCVAIIAAVMVGPLPADGQTAQTAPPVPTGREIVARHVAAIGGEKAYRSIDSIVARGRWEIPAQRLSGSLELKAARPSLMLYRVTILGIGRIESGFNGRIGWTISPLSGPELLAGKQLSETADEAWFDSAIYPAEKVRELSTVGLETFDGRQAYRLKVVFASGNEQFDFFDTETGLRIGTEVTRATASGSVPTVNLLRDYKAFGPLLQATTLVQRALGFEQVVTITSCEYTPHPQGTFDPPAEIQALISR
jgi:hypothetical protein